MDNNTFVYQQTDIQTNSETHLWNEFKACNCIWIGYKCQASATFNHLTDIGCAALVRQMPQYTEYREAGQHRCECVQCRDNCRISINIVIESIERCVHYQIPETNGQREEALRDCRIPNLMRRQQTNSIIIRNLIEFGKL